MNKKEKLILDYLSSGCIYSTVLDSEIIDEEKAYTLCNVFYSIVSNFPENEQRLKRLINIILKDNQSSKYFYEISYKWLSVLSLYYDRSDTFKQMDICCFSKSLLELTSIENNYKVSDDLRMSDIFVSTLCRFDGHARMTTIISYLIFYFLFNYLEDPIKTEIMELIKDDVLPKDFGQI